MNTGTHHTRKITAYNTVAVLKNGRHHVTMSKQNKHVIPKTFLQDQSYLNTHKTAHYY